MLSLHQIQDCMERWILRPMDLFVDKQLLLARSQEPVTDVEESLRGKIVGIYFSAGWCPPCRDFTPLLAEVYQEVGERKLPFEVIFVSCDKRKEDMLKYMEGLHGDWLCLPFGDKYIRYEMTLIETCVAQ